MEQRACRGCLRRLSAHHGWRLICDLDAEPDGSRAFLNVLGCKRLARQHRADLDHKCGGARSRFVGGEEVRWQDRERRDDIERSLAPNQRNTDLQAHGCEICTIEQCLEECRESILQRAAIHVVREWLGLRSPLVERVVIYRRLHWRAAVDENWIGGGAVRSEEHTSELQS